ncbi:hypothetical protein [Sphingobacterium siyangense]|uniref:hypothetical protein n=1 Tax=Sphingobacterium siyangense TaxID=459529 RepID=UPI003DA45BF9
MNTIEIPEKNIVIEIPDSWDECSPEQVYFLLEKAFKVISGKMSIGMFRIIAFQHFTGLKFGISYRVKQRLGLNQKVNSEIARISKIYCDWIFEEDDDQYHLTFDSVINYFPKIKRCYGPADLLADLTFGEFQQALVLMNEYTEGQESGSPTDQPLYEFIKLLYRPKIKGQRVALTGYRDKSNFKLVPDWKLKATLMWFTNCIQAIKEEDLNISGVEVNFSPLFPAEEKPRSKRKGLNLGWNGILLDVAASGVFGKAAEVNETPLYEILFYLLKKQDDHKQQMDAINKNR